LHLARHRAGALSSSPEDIGDGVDELAQDEPGIPQDRVIRCVVLVEVTLVVGGMDEDLAVGNVGGHAVAREAAPDAEDDVRPRQELVERPRHDTAAARPERQRVFSGNALLPSSVSSPAPAAAPPAPAARRTLG